MATHPETEAAAAVLLQPLARAALIAESLDGEHQQRADQVKPKVAILGGVGSAPYLDPLATAGFNSLREPGVSNLDLSVFSDFRIKEEFGFQFRAESFNLTNTPHFANPGTNLSNMQLNSDGSVRNLNGTPRLLVSALQAA